MQREQKITLGEMRSSGGPNGSSSTAAITSAAHSVLIDAGRWGDDVRLSDMEPKFTCQRPSGRADVRPLFEQARMGTGGSLGALMQAPVIVAPDLAQ